MLKKHVRQRVNFTDEWLIDKSIKFIQENEPEEGYYLGFSGGKDSIVLYDIVKKSKVKFTAYYSATGIDPPIIVKFIKKNYPEVIFIKPKVNFYSGIIKNGLPTIYKRWCCKSLKHTPLSVVNLKHRLMGIRSEESTKRKKRGKVNPHDKQIIYSPLFEWSEYNIWNYIEKNNLIYPSLYDEGLNRIGCVICPFINYKQKMINKELYPGIYRAFEKKAFELYVEKDKTACAGETFEEWLNYWYHHNYFKVNTLEIKDAEKDKNKRLSKS